MADDLVRSLKSRRELISAALDAAKGSPALAAVKKDIIALFKQVDGAITELSALKEEIREAGGPLQAGRGAGAGADGRRARSSRPRARSCTPTTSARRPSSRRGGASSRSATTTARARRSPRRSSSRPAIRRPSRCSAGRRCCSEKYDDALGTFQKVLMREPRNSLARINVGYICLKKGIFGEAIEHLSKAIRLDNDKKATLYAHFYLGLVYLEREMYEDAENFFRKTLVLGPEPDRGVLRDGPRLLVQRASATRPRRRGRRGSPRTSSIRGARSAATCSPTVAAGGAPPPP